jgi:hypothetical protein
MLLLGADAFRLSSVLNTVRSFFVGSLATGTKQYFAHVCFLVVLFLMFLLQAWYKRWLC